MQIDKKILDYLKDQRVGVLAVEMLDGSPHGATVHFAHTEDPRFAERFEFFAFGSELGNNYSELNDPVDLRQRFVDEKQKEKAGFGEAHQTDADYLEAIEHGFPPACGIAIGIDRMAMLYTNAKNIKEVIASPTTRTQLPFLLS